MKNKGKFRNTIMSLMVFIITVNYIDRGALAYAQEPIIKMFNLDPASWGWVLGFFGYGYIVGTLFGGALADKKGPKFVWVLSVTLWSIFAIATAWAGDIGMFLFGSAIVGFALCRIVFGLAEGPVYATMNRTIANWVPIKDRTFYVGIGLIGTPLGALLTAPIAVGLLAISDWKTMFIILGVAGLIWIVIWNKVFTNMPEEHPNVSKEELSIIREGQDELEPVKNQSEPKAAPIKWYDFFKNTSLILNSISFFAFNYVNFLILTWTPKYLQDVFDFKLSSLWYLGMVPWIGAVFTVFLGGKLSTVLSEKSGSFRIARSGVVMVCLLITSVCFFIIPYMNSITAILLLMMFGNAINTLPQSIYWAIVIDAAPSKAGTFSGITHFIITSASIIAPTLTGVLVAAQGYGAMFNAASLIAFIGMISMFFVKPSNTNIKQQELPQKLNTV
ncbi:MFS transporter [Peribacillus sp. NPDC058002]|uniref:MFS transporter n=1 Tax=Peribacillus sp. NPDC058002 TaxID=3346301 RepID=UPI0036D876DC